MSLISKAWRWVITTWAGRGLALLVASYFVAVGLAGQFADGDATPFTPTKGYVALGGVILLATAVERIGEVLGGLWGAQPSQPIKAKAAALAGTDHPRAAALHDHANAMPQRIGVAKARRLAARAEAVAADPAADDTVRTQAKQTAVAANQVADDAALSRPTIALPLAAITTVICAQVGVFAIHALSVAGTLDHSRWGFASDALVTGLIVSGGTKPLHDMIDLLSAKSDAAKAG